MHANQLNLVNFIDYYSWKNRYNYLIGNLLQVQKLYFETFFYNLFRYIFPLELLLTTKINGNNIKSF